METLIHNADGTFVSANPFKREGTLVKYNGLYGKIRLTRPEKAPCKPPVGCSFIKFSSGNKRGETWYVYTRDLKVIDE